MSRLYFLILCVAIESQSQVIQTARYEMPVAEENAEFKVVPWNNNGLIIHRRIELAKTDVLQFIKLDSSLNEHWVSSINVSKQLSLAFSKGNGDKAYFLFKPKNFFGDFQLFSVLRMLMTTSMVSSGLSTN